MRLRSYLLSAESILLQYNGAIPFASWLKNYFRENKKFGSKDRRAITDLCYCYFRLGKAFPDCSSEERFIIGQFLCHDKSLFVQEVKPEWLLSPSLSIAERLQIVGGRNEVSNFPFIEDVSHEIEEKKFSLSHLIQPDLFLRIRPNKMHVVLEKLKQASLHFSVEGDVVRLPISSKVDEIIALDQDAVVQDKSSQQVLNPLKETWSKDSFTAWDCCAASGGKSILLHDLFPKAQMTVSDIRESILHNLKHRFGRAGIQQYNSFVADVSSPAFRSTKKYDVIICDAPCSGSGTWGRTPEQLTYFTSDRIDHYASLQKHIALNASKSLKGAGAFVYITCSVFAKENEDVVEYILQNTSMKLERQQYFKGYTEKADTLFAALFTL
jgi:16S rRNA (cytosine967-C5)-methyltransferase